MVKNLLANLGDVGLIPVLESLLEKEMAAYSRTVACSHGQRNLAGYSPWDRKRIGQDLATKQQHSLSTYYLPGSENIKLFKM